MEDNRDDQAVYRFIYKEIDSVPHLEALLLVWNSRPQPWSVENLAKRLYIDVPVALDLLRDLERRGLVVSSPEPPNSFRYESASTAQDQLIADLDATYRREVVRIST